METGQIMNHFLKKSPLRALFLSVLFIFSLQACSEPANLTLAKNEAKNYYVSGEYHKELAQVINEAHEYIINEALINQKKKNPEKLALVLDIDETSLSNYKNMIKRDFTGTREQFHEDIMAADAPAIAPTLALYKDAIQHGIKIFFVTGRSEEERLATKTNLKKIGYTQWTALYLRPKNYTEKTIVTFKSHARALITKKGYTIIASIGDQRSDIKGGYVKKGFKLPNPYYYLP